MKANNVLTLSRTIILAGAIIAIVLGAVDIVTSAIGSREFLSGTISVTFGIISAMVLQDIKSETTNIVLIVLGFITQNVGGFLIGSGGIIALISNHILSKEDQVQAPKQ